MSEHRYQPQYPVLFRAPGERCQKVQYRTGGRVHLQCVRRVHGPEVNHLMDIMDRDAVEGSRGEPETAIPATEIKVGDVLFDVNGLRTERSWNGQYTVTEVRVMSVSTYVTATRYPGNAERGTTQWVLENWQTVTVKRPA